MNRVRESTIVKRILDYLNSLPQTRARKTHGGSYSKDWPDIVGCHQGRALFIEVKAPGGNIRPGQIKELAAWRSTGGITGIVYSVDDVKQLLASD